MLMKMWDEVTPWMLPGNREGNVVGISACLAQNFQPEDKC